MDYKEKGKKIADLRKRKNLTQKELAMQLHLTDKAISRWENGLGMPDVSILPELSQVLDVSIADLLDEKKDKTDIEMEIRIKLSEQEFIHFEDKCKRDSAFVYQKEQRQIDDYYTTSYRDFTKEKYPYEWLSIRQRGGHTIVNYKHWYPEGALKNTHCDEYEVEIDDQERMDKIFKALGIHPFARVTKTRKLYVYKNQYEICLDHIEELGYFIEVEVKKIGKNREEEYEDLLRLACKWHLNLENMDRRGYAYHFIDQKSII